MTAAEDGIVIGELGLPPGAIDDVADDAEKFPPFVRSSAAAAPSRRRSSANQCASR